MIHQDVLLLIARRVPRPDNFGCPEESDKATMLALMAGAEKLRTDLGETLDELAKLAAMAGASNPERGAAVGKSKQAAGKRWGDPRASRVAQQ